MKHKPRSLRRRPEIDITPLIDVLLVLLVIFMVITPLTPTGLDAAVPRRASQSPSTAAEAAIVISMDESGNIRINQRDVELPDLGPRLDDIFRSHSDGTVYVSADSVIDLVVGAGASRVGLITNAIE